MRPLSTFYEPCVILVTDHASFITENLKMNGTAVISTLLPDLQTRTELLPTTYAYINYKRSVFASGGEGETTFRPTDSTRRISVVCHQQGHVCTANSFPTQGKESVFLTLRLPD